MLATASRLLRWQGLFTPSVRLWLSLLAIFSLLKVWFIGEDSPMVAAYAHGFRAAGVTPIEGETFESIGRAAALWTFGLVPFLQFAAMFLLAAVYPAWARRPTSPCDNGFSSEY